MVFHSLSLSFHAAGAARAHGNVNGARCPLVPSGRGRHRVTRQLSFRVRSPLTSVSLAQSAARPPPLPPSLVRRAPLSFHSRRNPHRRRRSSIVGIDPQMMTNAPFFRMKTALAKPATRPAVQGARSAFPFPSPLTVRMKIFPMRENCGVVGRRR